MKQLKINKLTGVNPGIKTTFINFYINLDKTIIKR